MDYPFDNIPTLHTEMTQVEASRYNRIRLGLLRADLPLRVPLGGLRGMDMVLTHDAWVCIDRTFYDLPVMAWTGFEPWMRSSLQDPVVCKLHYYHVHADFIVNSVLSAAVNALRARAARRAGRTDAGPGSDSSADSGASRIVELASRGVAQPPSS